MSRKFLIPAGWLMLLVFGVSCNQPTRTSKRGEGGALPVRTPDTVFQIHWLGKRQLLVDGSAFYFTRLWNLPESKQVENHAFNRLAAAPWRLLQGEASLSDAPVSTLRPLFDSLAHEESYFEIRSDGDGLTELALAIRLDEESSRGWQTNLTLIAQSLTGFSPVPGRKGLPGLTLTNSELSSRWELARVGNWTVIGVASGENELMDHLINHVTSSTDPFGTEATNTWLRLETDLNWLATALGLTTNGSSALPFLTASVTGDGGHVLTDCNLRFPEPFRGDPQPWIIPRGVVREPLTGFLAVRGLRSTFTRLPGWSDLALGEIPDQMFAWSQPESAFQLYLAAPVEESDTQMEALKLHLLNSINPWLEQHGPEVNGQPCPLFHEIPGVSGVLWGRMQGVQPFARAISTGASDFLLTGLLPPHPSEGAAGLRPELGESLAGTTNLVYLGWEDTGTRLGNWLPVLQTTRAVTGRAPIPERSLSLAWLSSLQNRLDDTLTTATRTGPHNVTIHRKSSLGLNAMEMQMIADWLESPGFPRGLHTFLGEVPQAAQ